MVEKIFVQDDGTAMFSCPACRYARSRNVNSLMEKASTVKIKCTCKCGHVFTALLERRGFVRKRTALAGIYRELNSGQQGLMTVRDLSRSGMCMRLNVPQDVGMGKPMEVEFRLDDDERTLIRREGIVRYVNELNIGIEFDSTEHFDKLGGLLAFR